MKTSGRCGLVHAHRAVAVRQEDGDAVVGGALTRPALLFFRRSSWIVRRTSRMVHESRSGTAMPNPWPQLDVRLGAQRNVAP